MLADPATDTPTAAPPSGPGQRRGVRVQIEPTEVIVDPGREVTATVTVRNLGTRVEEFRLAPSGAAAGLAAIEPITLSVYPNDEQHAVVRFAPARGPQSVAGVAPFEVTASSTIHADVIDVARGQLTITPFQELRALLWPVVSRGRRTSRHQVSVTNDGNTPVSTELAFRDQDGQLAFEPPSGAATLQPGAGVSFPVRISGRCRWSGRPERLPFSAVISQAGPQPPITLHGTRYQSAVLPWWIPTAALALVAIAVALFAVWPTPTVPHVADLTLIAAEKELREAGYVVSGATEIPDPRQVGLVVKTDPAAGSELGKGKRVHVFVSSGLLPSPAPQTSLIPQVPLVPQISLLPSPGPQASPGLLLPPASPMPSPGRSPVDPPSSPPQNPPVSPPVVPPTNTLSLPTPTLTPPPQADVTITSPVSGAALSRNNTARGTAHLASNERLWLLLYAPGIGRYYIVSEGIPEPGDTWAASYGADTGEPGIYSLYAVVKADWNPRQDALTQSNGSQYILYLPPGARYGHVSVQVQ